MSNDASDPQLCLEFSSPAHLKTWQGDGAAHWELAPTPRQHVAVWCGGQSVSPVLQEHWVPILALQPTSHVTARYLGSLHFHFANGTMKISKTTLVGYTEH